MQGARGQEDGAKGEDRAGHQGEGAAEARHRAEKVEQERGGGLRQDAPGLRSRIQQKREKVSGQLHPNVPESNCGAFHIC